MAETETLTLADLRIALEMADATRIETHAALDADPVTDAVEQDWNAPLQLCWSVVDQIAAVPATSLADLRVKAWAIDWSAKLLDGETFYNPSEGEEKIFAQLVAGLLDERFF